MKTRTTPFGTVIRALLSTFCLLLLASVSEAQTSIGRDNGQGPAPDSKASVIDADLAKNVLSRIQADHPDLGPARLYRLLQQDLARDGVYSTIAAGMIGGLYLSTNEKLALLFLAGVALGVLLH